jgi:hypothetical protein
MERNIPLVAWIIIGCLVAMVVILNFSLWTAWKRKKSDNSLNVLKKSGQILRQPWQKEDEQLEKLAHETAKLKRDKPDTPEDSGHIHN